MVKSTRSCCVVRLRVAPRSSCPVPAAVASLRQRSPPKRRKTTRVPAARSESAPPSSGPGVRSVTMYGAAANARAGSRTLATVTPRMTGLLGGALLLPVAQVFDPRDDGRVQAAERCLVVTQHGIEEVERQVVDDVVRAPPRQVARL